MADRYVPETGFTVDTDLVYNLMHSSNRNGSLSYRDGKPQMCNDVMIRLTKAHTSKMSTEELEAFAKYIAKCANDYMFVEFNTAFEQEPDEDLVGHNVRITQGMHNQRVGIVEEQFPAGKVAAEIVYSVRMSNTNVGHFTIDQFDVLN